MPQIKLKLKARGGPRTGLRHYEFSKANLAIVALVVAGIGGYFLLTSSAASPVGDANNDGQVNVTDLSILLTKYGTTDTSTDFNSDGTVNIIDLSTLLSHYGTVVSGGSGTSFSSIYGNPFSPNALSNLRLGDVYDYKAAYRFRADHTGQLDGFRVYWIDSEARPGYSDGNGGTIKINLQTDNGTSSHLPTGTILGQSLTWKPGLTDTPIGAVNPGGNAARFQYIKFPSPISVTQGQLYHLVFVNIDPNYTANFISVNGIVMAGDASPIGDTVISGLNSVDWGVSYSDNTNVWLNASPEAGGFDHSPVLDLGWTDGHHMGNGYMEVWTSKLRTLTTTGNVREQFTPTVAKTVNKLTVSAVAVTSGTLAFKLETASGTVVQQGQVNTTGDGKQHWYSFTLPTTSLSVGQQYNLVISAPTGSSKIYAIRDGNRDPFNFDPVTTFSDGKAQELKSGTWTNWENEWNTTPVDYADLSFYFSLAN